MTLTLGDQVIDRKYIEFNANRTFATVKVPSKLPTGTNKVSVSLPLMDPLTTSFTVEGEKVESIEILGDTAVRVAGNKVSIGYKALNQYGEEMDNPNLTASAEGDVVKDNLDPSFEDGRVLIPIDPSEIKEGAEIDLTLSQGDVKTTKKVQVSMKASLYQLDIIELKSESDSTTLNETTDLNEEAFYLVVKATDQFGGLIEDIDELGEDTFSVTSTNSSVVTVNNKFEEYQKEKGLYKLKLVGTLQEDGTTSLPSVGRTSIVLTAHASNQKSKPFAITVGEGQRVDTFTLEKPQGVTAGSDLKIQIQAKDKEGKSITDLDILKGSVSGITWTIDPDIPYEVEEDTDENELILTFKGKDVGEGTLKITGVTATNQEVITEIEVDEQARPTTWEWKSKEDEPEYDFVKEDTSTKENAGESSNEKENKWDSEVIKIDHIIVKDQYGKNMELPKGYSLQGHTNDKAVEVTGKITSNDEEITVTPKAVGKATVTFSLYKDDKEVVGSGREFVFTAKDDTKYIEYRLPEIGILYDALAAGKSISKEYAKEVVVYGILENGEAEEINGFTIEELKHVYPINSDLAKDDNNDEDLENKLLIQEKLVYTNGSTTKRDLNVTIDSTKEPLTQEIIISKEAPKVEKLEVENDSITFDEEINDDFEIGWKEILKKSKFTATDQYGVKSKDIDVIIDEKEETPLLEFPDGIEIKPMITFESIKGSQIFENSGKHNATITNFSAGSVVKATITVNGHSVNVNITMKKEHTPELDEVVESFKRNLCDEDECGDTGITVEISEGTKNIKDALQKYITHENYEIRISSVTGSELEGDVIIEDDGTINPITCKENECKDKAEVSATVSYTIFRTNKKDFEKKENKEINFNISKATEVILADGSLGEPGSHEITGLTSGKKYQIQVGKQYYAVPSDGVFAKEKIDEGEIESLEGTKITGLINGKTYKVEEVVPQKVNLQSDSEGKEGNKKITDLAEKNRYVIYFSNDDRYRAVKADGSLSTQLYKDWEGASEAADFLNGTEIKGLTNGETYKVKKATPKLIEGVTATLLDENRVKLEFPQITYAENVDVEYRVKGSEEWLSITKINGVLEPKIDSKSTTVEIMNLELEENKTYYFRLMIDDNASHEIYNQHSTETEGITITTIKQLDIEGVTVPKKGDKPVSILDGTDEYEAEISWDPNVTEFGADTAYTATITIIPKLGYTLKGVQQNTFKVADAKKVTHEENSGNIIVEFEKTESEETDEGNE